VTNSFSHTIIQYAVIIRGRTGFDGGKDGLSSEPSCRQLVKKVDIFKLTAEDNFALAA